MDFDKYKYNGFASFFPKLFLNMDKFDWGKQVLCDVDSGKEFILCEYNRDADSYR